MRALVGALCALSFVAPNAACTRRGGGPHIQLMTPPGASPSFGDAPSRATESMRQGPGGGGGGVTGSSEGGRGNAGGGVPIGPIVGGAVGVGAAAAAIGTGAVHCTPGTDSPSEGTKLNLCSGERASAPMTP